ncbi:hypothetical protein BaRGS_00015104, partial [Batillaria attramentaria]
IPGSCPPNVFTAVSLCLANTTRSKIGTNFHAIRNSCSEGVYTSAVVCVDQLNMDCEEHQNRHLFLRMFISTASIQQSFDMLLYKVNSGCMQEQNTAIEECDREEDHLLTSRLQEADDDMDIAMNALCTYHWGLRNCTVGLITDACGEDMGKFQWNIASGMIPPICEDLLNNGCAGVILGELWKVLLLSVLITPALLK